MLRSGGSEKGRAGKAEMGDIRRKQAGPCPLEQDAELSGQGGELEQIHAAPQHPRDKAREAYSSRTARRYLRVDTLSTIRFNAHSKSRSPSQRTSQLSRLTSLPAWSRSDAYLTFSTSNGTSPLKSMSSVRYLEDVKLSTYLRGNSCSLRAYQGNGRVVRVLCGGRHFGTAG